MTTGSGRRKKVIGIGIACLDQLLLWQDAGRPVRGNKIVAHDLQGGGMAATALVAVARLGGEAECWAAIGTDWAAEQIVRGLEQENVDTNQMVRVEGAIGPLMVVAVDQPTGERSFPYSSGVPSAAEPIAPPERLAAAGCLLVDGTLHKTALSAAREARRLGVPVVADIERLSEETRELLAHVDYAIASEAAARGPGAAGRYHEACDLIHAMGPTHVVITRGDQGCVHSDGATFLERKAFPVEVVDTTGAGDVFHGAFCYGLVEGFPLEHNLAFASAAAALKCRALGGRAGIPTRAEVEQFLEQHGALPPGEPM